MKKIKKKKHNLIDQSTKTHGAKGHRRHDPTLGRVKNPFGPTHKTH